MGFGGSTIGHALHITVVEFQRCKIAERNGVGTARKVDPEGADLPLVLLIQQIQTGPEKEISSEVPQFFPISVRSNVGLGVKNTCPTCWGARRRNWATDY